MTASKWARRMVDDPRADLERQAAERKAILRELRADLEYARDRREPWLVWLEARADAIHLHELARDDGSPIACPVAGCDAVRPAESSRAPDDAPRRQAEPRQLTF